MLKKLLEFLSDGEAFERNKKAALKRNRAALQITLVCMSVIFAFMLIVSLIFDAASLKALPYAIVLCASIAMLLLLLRLPQHGTMAFVYFIHGAMVLYAAISSAFIYPDDTCVTILSFIYLLQILYIDKSWRLDLFSLLSSAAYLVFVSFYKDPAIFRDEALNVVIFTLLGFAMGSFARKIQFNNYDMLERLRISEEQYRLVLLHSGNIMCRYDVADRSVNMSPDVARIFSMPEKVRDVPYYPIRQGTIAPKSVEAYTEFYESILRGEKSGTASFCSSTANGWRWLKANYTTIFADSGEPVYAVISLLDITEQREKELIYEKWKREIAEMSKEDTAFFEWNLTRDISEGQTGELIISFRGLPEDSFNKRTEVYAGQCVHPDDRQRYCSFLNREMLLWEYHEGTNTSELEYRELLPEGAFRWMHATVQLVSYPDSGEVKAYLIIKDIDAAKRRTLATESRAREDTLTRLLNRISFQEATMALLDGSGEDSRHAFLMIDVDNFKGVNDAFGHLEGDKLLRAVADRLRSMLRTDDLIGRLGGDEFAVCMRNVGDSSNVEKRADAICRALCKELDAVPSISASIGIALVPQDAASFDALYRKADIALYAAKDNGRNRYEFYSPELESRAYIASLSPIEETVPAEQSGQTSLF